MIERMFAFSNSAVNKVHLKPFFICLLATGIGFASLFQAGCSSTKPFDQGVDAGRRTPQTEICDSIDNDLDGLIDEDYRDDAGVYTTNEHCASCNNPCLPDEVTIASQCTNSSYGPACRPTECVPGYVPTDAPSCVSWAGRLCIECLDHGDCGGFDDARCADIAGESKCTVVCDDLGNCPGNYNCDNDSLCRPPSGSCSCEGNDNFILACTIYVKDQECFGTAVCDDGVLSECTGSTDICDGLDNDCDGIADGPYVDNGGFYNVDLHNCGACGVDCTLNPLPDHEITCGGHVTSPICAMLCEDVEDGIDVGDQVDADLLTDNGCECRVISLEDRPGSTSGNRLDSNCDGADGVVASSIYVSPVGDDSNPGSPSEPIKTISRAIETASVSLETKAPRPDIYVSSGAYEEVITLREGVQIHGSYRPDFLERDSSAHMTEVHSPTWNDSPGGAALVGEKVGLDSTTSVDGIHLRGASAPGDEIYAFGVFLKNVGDKFKLSDGTIQAGDGADGNNGKDGVAGESSPGGKKGADPRGAKENNEHNCISNTTNRVQGGTGSKAECSNENVNGGDGANSTCPGDLSSKQANGKSGLGPAGTPGGSGGPGGWNCIGPIEGGSGAGCESSICCDLADFLVSSDYEVAGDGQPGQSGQGGNGGLGCEDQEGRIVDDKWTSSKPSNGTGGKPGSGGGGGGAGGGSQMEWYDFLCPYADGLGGGGGGGGAGGCGGSEGKSGTSGGPSIGILVIVDNTVDKATTTPVIRDMSILTGAVGDGGDGGHGGDGGQGGLGGHGGALLPTQKLTPTLSGPTSGGHGGQGGSGGRGGGGGGGCGGSSIGIWIEATSNPPTSALQPYLDQNNFDLADGGKGGQGGGGGQLGNNGLSGEVKSVVAK
jgi:Putative metal-binding motif